MPNNTAPHDPLGYALESFKVSDTSVYFCELVSPWSFYLDETLPRFHFVTAGSCWLEVEGVEGCRLEAGDFVVVPRGARHRLSSDQIPPAPGPINISCEKVSDYFSVFRNNGKGGLTTVICGDVLFETPAADHLIELLPPIMRVRAAQYQMAEWLHCSSRLIAFEARESHPGGKHMIKRLADLMVIQSIRTWIEQNPVELKGWLGGFRDPSISKAIGLIHKEPAKDWTIGSLAREVAMSRSAFAERFSELVGEPVMQYLTRWRMHLASIYLATDGIGVEEVALRLGYQSGAAFSRAFKRLQGVSPGEARREAWRRSRSQDSLTSRVPGAEAVEKQSSPRDFNMELYG